jgi:cation:H+ antiporter
VQPAAAGLHAGRPAFVPRRWLLFALLVAYTVFLVVQSRRETQAAKDEFAEPSSLPQAGAWDSHWAGTDRSDRRRPGALVFGSDYLVQASVNFAKAWA